MTLLLRNSRKAWRGTPAFCASKRNLHHVLVDDREEEIDCNLTHPRQLPGAGYAAPRGAMARRAGLTSMKASSGPETTQDSFPHGRISDCR